MPVDNTCPIDQMLLANENVIGAMVWSKRLGFDRWNDYVKRIDKAEATGYNIRYSVGQRIKPKDLALQEVQAPNGVSSACDGPVTELEWPGIEAKALTMYTGMLKTPELCLSDLRDAANGKYFLDNWVDQIDDAVGYTFQRIHQKFYTDAPGNNKVVVMTGTAAADPVSNSGSFPAIAATGTLTYNRLKQAFDNLQYEVQGQDEAIYAGGRRFHTVLLSMEAREQLLRQDAGIRDDLRFGDPIKLLDPMGREVIPYRDFMLEEILYPARWNFVNGQWVEVKPFSDNADPVTVGNAADVSPDYKNATYEDAYIFNPMAYFMAVPTLPTIRWGKGKIVFTPQNYMGEWKFHNITSQVCIEGTNHIYNPLGNKVFGIANFELGPVYPRPELAYIFRYRRCGYGNDSISCST